MKKLVLLACVTLPLSVLAQGGLPDKPYIYVEGRAEIEKPADMVTLRFELVARNPDQAKANQEVQAKATTIFDKLNERKIEKNDVIAADLRSEPVYENDEEDSYRKRGKIVGCKVARPFTVKVRDVTASAKLVNELLVVPGVQFSGIDPGLSNEKEMQAVIWDKALENAREQAERTVKTMGVKIDSVFAISPVAFPRIHSQIFRSYDDGGTERVIVTGPPEYRLGPLTVSQHAYVIYLISPAK